MIIIFRRFSEYLTLNLDRKNKLLKVNGEKTNYQIQELPWRMLWDRCDYHKRRPKEDNLTCDLCGEVARHQDKDTEAMEDSDFVKVFEEQMKVYGYNVVKWEL